MKKIDIHFRIPQRLHRQMLDDLRRPHPFAFERVGFLYTTSVKMPDKTILIIATEYTPVEDTHYINDYSVGAKINSDAIRTAMQRSLKNQTGCFHVHIHDHRGKPTPSRTDIKSLPGVVESLCNIAPDEANGYLILSRDSFYAGVKVKGIVRLQTPKIISAIGKPMLFSFKDTSLPVTALYDRQSFLGPESSLIFDTIKVGIVGYGGGGSHIGQQLTHIGIKNLVVFDGDIVEETNLNRLIGACPSDVKDKTTKTKIAKRAIKKINPKANVVICSERWQQRPELIHSCDVVFGAVDSYGERDQLEAECRRYLIPLLDIGMDVHQSEDSPFSMSGQVILSMPGSACMRCFQFLTEKKLALEAAKYGKVGGRPQVVWPNGVLASTAVGLFVNLVTNWTQDQTGPAYLEYDGNTGLIREHIRASFTKDDCSHYPLEAVGKPKFIAL